MRGGGCCTSRLGQLTETPRRRGYPSRCPGRDVQLRVLSNFKTILMLIVHSLLYERRRMVFQRFYLNDCGDGEKVVATRHVWGY